MVDIPANHLWSKKLVCPEMCDLHQCPRKSSNVHVFSASFGVTFCRSSSTCCKWWKVASECLHENWEIQSTVCVYRQIYIYIHICTRHWLTIERFFLSSKHIKQGWPRNLGLCFFCTSTLIRVLKALVKMLGCSLNSTPNKATFPSL